MKTAKEGILEILESMRGNPLAVHQIGEILRDNGIWCNDPAVSAILRAKPEKSGCMGLVKGRRRQGTRYKEWEII